MLLRNHLPSDDGTRTLEVGVPNPHSTLLQDLKESPIPSQVKVTGGIIDVWYPKRTTSTYVLVAAPPLLPHLRNLEVVEAFENIRAWCLEMIDEVIPEASRYRNGGMTTDYEPNCGACLGAGCGACAYTPKDQSRAARLQRWVRALEGRTAEGLVNWILGE